MNEKKLFHKWFGMLKMCAQGFFKKQQAFFKLKQSPLKKEYHNLS